MPSHRRRRDDQGAHRRHDLDRPGRPWSSRSSSSRCIGLRRRRRARPSIRPPRRRCWPASSTSRSINLLPLVLLVILSLRRVPPFLSIFGRALFAGVLASFTQPAAVEAFVGEPDQGRSRTASRRSTRAMATGFVSNTGNETIDALFSRGGMASMLTTIWLVLGALSLRRDHGGRRLPGAPGPAHRARSAKSTGRLIASVIGTVHRPERHRRRPVRRRSSCPAASTAPSSRDAGSRRGCCRGRSRTPARSPRRSSPWNSCGAYMAGVLGVATVAYLPFCFFNLLSPRDLAVLRVHRLQDRAPPHRRARRPGRRRRSPARLEALARGDPHDDCRSASHPAAPRRAASAGSRCRPPTRSCSC